MGGQVGTAWDSGEWDLRSLPNETVINELTFGHGVISYWLI